MTKISPGSPAWFKLKRRTVADFVRTRDALEQARNAIARIIHDWDKSDIEVKGALHNSAVIHYARPFTDRPQYGGKALKRSAGFDSELHKHLLQIRHNLIAHHDNDTLQSRVGYQEFTLTLNGKQYPVRVAAYVLVKAMHGIANRAVADRYFLHVSACVECFCKLAEQELAALYEAAVQTPEVADLGNEVFAQTRVPIDITSITARIPSAIEARGAHIPDPVFPLLPADAYVYRAACMTHARKGKIEIQTPEGVALLEISDTPPAVATIDDV